MHREGDVLVSPFLWPLLNVNFISKLIRQNVAVGYTTANRINILGRNRGDVSFVAIEKWYIMN